MATCLKTGAKIGIVFYYTPITNGQVGKLASWQGASWQMGKFASGQSSKLASWQVGKLPLANLPLAFPLLHLTRKQRLHTVLCHKEPFQFVANLHRANAGGRTREDVIADL